MGRAREAMDRCRHGRRPGGAGAVVRAGVLSPPEGDIEPTGRRLRLRECDVLTVANGVAVAHRFYYDRLEFLAQLGLTAPDTAAGTVPQPRAGAERPPQVGAAEPPR